MPNLRILDRDSIPIHPNLLNQATFLTGTGAVLDIGTSWSAICFWETATVMQKTGLTPKDRVRLAGQVPLIVHLHIPKTAGSTLAALFEADYSDKFLRFNRAPDEVMALSDDQLRSYAVISGHLPARFQRRLPADSVYVLVVREPLARIYSLFEFIRRRPQHHLHTTVATISFGTFVDLGSEHPAVKANIDNTQLRFIGSPRVKAGQSPEAMLDAARVLIESDRAYCGLQENFDAFLARLRDTGILGNQESLHENVGDSGKRLTDALASLTPGQAEKLDEFTRWDQKIYDMIKARNPA